MVRWCEQVSMWYCTEMSCFPSHIVSLDISEEKVSLRSPDQSFKQCVCVDYLVLDSHRIFHVMDTKSRFSPGLICDNMVLEYSAYTIVSCWLIPLCTPDSVRGDDAFKQKPFQDFVAAIGSKFERVPPRRHQKNILESRHGVIRSIYIRPRGDAPTTDAHIHVAQRLWHYVCLRT